MTGMRRWCALAFAVALGSLSVGSVGSGALAAPAPPQNESTEQPVVDVGGSVGEALTGVTESGAVMALEALTGAGGFQLDRGDATRSITVPVPAGLVLTEVRADATIAAGGADTTLVVAVDGVEVARLTLPDATSAIRLPVAAAAGGEAVVTLSLLDGGCGIDEGVSSMQLTNVGFAFTGVPAVPATIADFLPAVMTSAVIVESAEPTDTEKNATYALAAALARRYAVPPAISIVRDAGFEPTRFDPFERVFAPAESVDDVLAVVPSGAASVLQLRGTAERLADTAASMASADLVLLTSSVSDDPPVPVDLDRGQLTGVRDLLDLGVDDTERTGAAALEVVIPLPQSAFGEPVARLRLALSGIASSGAEVAPVVSLTVNDRLVELIDVDPNGTFVVAAEISAPEMRRDNVVVLRSELPPCDPAVGSHRLVVSTSSTVDAAPGQSLAPSLDRFPQVAIGDEGIVVAAGSSLLEQQVAATMVAALQTASPFVIRTIAGNIDTAVSGAQPALVVSEPNEAITAALRSADVPGAGDQFAPGLAAMVALDTDVFAVVLSGGPGATVQLLNSVNSSGWSTFLGRVVGFDEAGARTAVEAAGPIDVEFPPDDAVAEAPTADATTTNGDTEDAAPATAVVVIETPADESDTDSGTGADIDADADTDAAEAVPAAGNSDEGSRALEPFLIGLFISLLVIGAILSVRSFFRMITGRSIRS